MPRDLNTHTIMYTSDPSWPYTYQSCIIIYKVSMTCKTDTALGIHADLEYSTQNSNMIPIIPSLTQIYRQGPEIDDKITKHSWI